VVVSLAIRQAPAVSRAAPIIAGPANGDMPAMVNGENTTSEKATANVSAKPINRLNGKKMNGHNRVKGLLEPVAG
jgi:hypothetical protein